VPCNSCGRPSGDDYEARKKIERLEAMLCALIKVTGLDTSLDKVDWAEAGVDAQDLRKWWTDHQEKDRQRRDRERHEADRERLRAEALAKLSPEEKVALFTGLPARWK
jgi:hypothetical protein